MVLIENNTGMRVFGLYIVGHLDKKFLSTLHEYDDAGLFIYYINN